MNNVKFRLLLLLMLTFSGCNFPEEKLLVDSLAINVEAPGRIFSFTNKAAGQYSGQTHSAFMNGWEGWIVREQKIFNDYKLFFDGKLSERGKSKVSVLPYELTREYPGGITESFLFPDSTNDIFIKISSGKLTGLELNGIAIQKFLSKGDNSLSFSLNTTSKENIFTIRSTCGILSYSLSPDKLTINFDGEDENLINFSLSGSVPSDDIEKNYASARDAKRKRINTLLTGLGLETDNPEFTKAMLWAVASLDALITKQQVTGIFAGLPWFNNYWGRDTFIALPGATFVTGNMKDARDVLLNFAAYQDNDPASKYYGRIPNRITLNETIYNTVDGTPWFVIQAYNYYKYSGDIDFLRRIYPQVKLAFISCIANRIDNYGFLLHDDAETWMDAVGPAGPWSPRGNRAVDIQALWYRQLLSTVSIADLMGDTILSVQAAGAALKLQQNFNKFFIDDSGKKVYDRLKPDGAPDLSVRPNLFFALNETGLIDDYRSRLSIIEGAMDELVTPYGVFSLSRKDENFHPFHEYPPFYPKDAAYHNGIIWQWNTGPVVQTLCSFGLQDTAWVLTRELTKQILNRGAAGTLAELSEAYPREGEQEIKLSGTFSQAWSLGEYIRNFYQDYLGVSPDAPNKTLYLIPYLPASLRKVAFNQKVGKDEVRVNYLFNESNYSVVVEPKKISTSIDLGISLINKAGANFLIRTEINKDQKFIAIVPANSKDSSDLMTFRNDDPVKVTSQFYLDPVSNASLYSKIRLSREPMRSGIKSIRPPEYALLKLKDIKKSGKNSRVIISAEDKINDEKYSYPSNTNFVKGILDIQKFSVSESNDDYRFTIRMKDLHNPGWHPEYGFQLTLVTICLSTDAPGTGSLNVGENSNYKLSAKRTFNRKIVLGGGFEIKDGSGKILASYIPLKGDEADPLGNSNENVITFSVPKKYLGTIKSNTKISVFAGAQDDHGGAGVGVFRSVNAAASEWNGGGKASQDADNIFDELILN